MGPRHLKEGQDFGAEHFKDSDFGFSGSAEGYDGHGSASPPFTGDTPTHGGMEAEPYAKGGAAGHHHPHGHHVIRVHHDPASGIVIHHHAHGGHSMHHPDGTVTHHDARGGPVMAGPSAGNAMMQTGHHQEGTHVGKMMHHGHKPPPHHSMPPAMGRDSNPENTAPRNPMRNPSSRNAMPGGQMPYGVEPSAEPDDAGSEQGIPQMRKGGRAKSEHRG